MGKLYLILLEGLQIYAKSLENNNYSKLQLGKKVRNLNCWSTVFLDSACTSEKPQRQYSKIQTQGLTLKG